MHLHFAFKRRNYIFFVRIRKFFVCIRKFNFSMIYNDFSYSKHFDDDRELNEQAQNVQEKVKQEEKK